MEDDSGEFVGSRRDCLSRAQFAPHPPEKFAQRVVGVVQRVRRKPEGEGHPILYGASPHIEDLSTADLLFRAEAQPGSKCRGVAELAKIRPDLAENRVGLRR